MLLSVDEFWPPLTHGVDAAFVKTRILGDDDNYSPRQHEMFQAIYIYIYILILYMFPMTDPCMVYIYMLTFGVYIDILGLYRN